MEGRPSRTYAIPYEDVWQSLLLVVGEHPRWAVLEADGDRGILGMEVRPRLLGQARRLDVTVGLDPQGQTRVEVARGAPAAGPDWRGGRRSARRLLRALDHFLARRRSAADPPQAGHPSEG